MINDVVVDAAAAGSGAEPELPPYEGVALANVRLVKGDLDAAVALAALMASDAIGFDTESKPTFRKGEVSTGPHLIQLAADEIVYLFQSTGAVHIDVLKAILESPTIVKAGFGLRDDLKRLQTKFGIETANVVDLAILLRDDKYNDRRKDIGAKTAVARFFGKKLQKSKRTSTTNWANPHLNDRQILYAADDAQVALKVYRVWKAQQAENVSVVRS